MENDDNFRAPVSDVFRRKTPFIQLVEHMCKVSEGIGTLEEGLIKYYKGEYEGFSDIAKKVSKIEHEADIIKGNLRNHLPSHLYSTLVYQEYSPIHLYCASFLFF